jgi:hypothetical protein
MKKKKNLKMRTRKKKKKKELRHSLSGELEGQRLSCSRPELAS